MVKGPRGGKRANHRVPIKIQGSSKDFHYVKDSMITNERVFAGYRQRNKLNEAVTKGLTAEFGGKERLWQHGSEEGSIIVNGEIRRVEVHWFRNGPSGQKRKHQVKKMDRLTVTFPSDKTGCPEFTPGKIYVVISVEQGWYRVVNDWGMDYLYPPDFFNEGEYTDGEYLKP